MNTAEEQDGGRDRDAARADPDARRDARLAQRAASLRANLKRRKTQSRARADAAEVAPHAGPDLRSATD